MAGSPSIASLFAQRVVIGVGDMAVSNLTQVVLSTYALGSCIGVVAYDPVVKAGGILHLMLPDSTISPEKAAKQPAMFADTGLPMIFRALVGMKAERRNLRVFLAGGAAVLQGEDTFKIGERNAQAATKFMQANGIYVKFSDLGGQQNRTIHLEVATGRVTMKMPQGTEDFLLTA
jgi:chemotaxis protein CheD